MKDKLPIIISETIINLPDHQILLGFNSDDEALDFHDWWWERGADMYIDWLEDQESN